MQLRNNRLDALFYQLRGYSVEWIGKKFGVHKVTAARWVREAKKDSVLLMLAAKRLKAIQTALEEDFL
jgi:transposase